MSDIKVSVIVPVYNAQKYLKQTLELIAGQTLRQIEIICVDDGSTDDSFHILNSFKDERLKVIHQENGGAGKARNTGLKIARGEYLYFPDADDFFEKDLLEKAYSKAIEHNSDIVVFESDQYYEENDEYKNADWTIHKEDLPAKRPFTYKDINGSIFRTFVGWAWDKLFKRQFIEENSLSFQEIRSSNDMRLVFSALVLAEKIDLLDETLYHQRRNVPGSVSNSREKSFDHFHSALISLKETLNEKGLFENLKEDYIDYCLHFSLWHLNTIKDKKKKELYTKLKDEWFDEFGITSSEKNIFKKKSEYIQYSLIKVFPFPLWKLIRRIIGILR